MTHSKSITVPPPQPSSDDIFGPDDNLPPGVYRRIEDDQFPSSLIVTKEGHKFMIYDDINTPLYHYPPGVSPQNVKWQRISDNCVIKSIEVVAP